MDPNYKKVVILGLGYIGLPTAAVLASRGVHVVGVDINANVVRTVSKGEVHIVEPDLESLVNGVVKGGFLRASATPEEADAFIIAVPTPFAKNHEPDLTYVETAVQSIAPFLRKGNLLVLESTSPVGTTERVAKLLASIRVDLKLSPHEPPDINIAYCPERVLPGRILSELLDNDRIIGGLTEACAQRAKDLYRIFVKGECLITNARTAELCKLTENSFRDVNIAFANELSLVCDHLNIDVWELIELANHHPRVNILRPGPGVGGHCIAVDPWFIVSSAPEQTKLIRTARDVNDFKPVWVVNQVIKCANNIKKERGRVVVGCLGLTFKADIDDMRESPAVEIVQRLSEEQDLDIIVNEPHISELPNSLRKAGVKLVSLEKIIKSSDILVILVDHSTYKKEGWSTLGMPIIDTRGMIVH